LGGKKVKGLLVSYGQKRKNRGGVRHWTSLGKKLDSIKNQHQHQGTGGGRPRQKKSWKENSFGGGFPLQCEREGQGGKGNGGKPGKGLGKVDTNGVFTRGGKEKAGVRKAAQRHRPTSRPAGRPDGPLQGFCFLGNLYPKKKKNTT